MTAVHENSVHTTYNSTGETALTVDLNATINADDWLLVVIQDWLNGQTFSAAPTDWAKISNISHNDDGSGCFQGYELDLADGTEDGATVDFNVGSSTARWHAGCSRFSGSAGVDVTGAGSHGFGSSFVSPSVTTTVDDCLIISVLKTGGIGSNITAPSGTTSIYNYEMLGDGTSHISIATSVQATAGATTARTWTLDGDDLGIGFTIALAPAASGATIELASGSFAITGATIDSLHHQRIAVESGSFALTGAAVDTLQNTRIGIESGSFAITGAAIDSLHHQRVELESGSFAISGSTIDTLQNIRVEIESGSFTLTGASIDSFYDRITTLESGAFVLTGSVIDTAVSGVSTIELEAGSFALTGAEIDSLHHQRIGLASGSFAISGSAIDSLVTLLVDLESGSFVLTGSNINQLYHQITTLESGAFTLTGAEISTAYSSPSNNKQIIGQEVTIVRTLSSSQAIDRILSQVGKLS